MVRGIFLEKQDAKSSPTNPTRRSSRGGRVRKSFFCFCFKTLLRWRGVEPTTISVVVPPVDPLPMPLDHSSGPLIGTGGDCGRAGSYIYSTGGGARRRETDRGVVGERKVWHLEWYLRWPVPYIPCHETFQCQRTTSCVLHSGQPASKATRTYTRPNLPRWHSYAFSTRAMSLRQL